MRIDVEDIKKAERRYFKEALLKIDPEIRVTFKKTDAAIVIDFFEIVTDELLEKKSKIKKAVYAFISNYRTYQFNQ